MDAGPHVKPARCRRSLPIGTGPPAELRALFAAAGRGRADEVARLLADPALKNSRVGGTAALHMAAMFGHTNVVALLLPHPHVDPSASGNKTLRRAATAGRAEVVALLLADPRTDPAVLDPPEFAALRAKPLVAAALAARRWSPLRAAWAAAAVAGAAALARADAELADALAGR
jgi:hypothetical protein